MSDTRPHVPSGEPVERDALDFGVLGWFVVILIATVVASQLVVWGMFEWFDSRVTRNEAPRAPMAAAPATPTIEGGRIAAGAGAQPLAQPALVVSEPMVLAEFLEAERREQREYGWVDEAMGVVLLPIERAKDLVIERGLPVRPAMAAPEVAAVPEAGAAPEATVAPETMPTPEAAPEAALVGAGG